MDNDLKPGDLCTITESLFKETRPNIGKTVTLVERIAPGVSGVIGNIPIHPQSETRWVVNGDGLIAVVLKWDDTRASLELEQIPVLEKYLMKIGDGEPDQSSIRSIKEPEEATC